MDGIEDASPQANEQTPEAPQDEGIRRTTEGVDEFDGSALAQAHNGVILRFYICYRILRRAAGSSSSSAHNLD